MLRRYRKLRPVTDSTPRVTLGEGDTPLVRSVRLEREIGCGALYFKLESCNPSGSFKDRGMVVAVAKALERGDTALLCASTGNTSSSAAAYAAHCGIQAHVIVPHGRIAEAKLAQTVAHGPHTIAVEASFDHALRPPRRIRERPPTALLTPVHPPRTARATAGGARWQRGRLRAGWELGHRKHDHGARRRRRVHHEEVAVAPVLVVHRHI